MENANKIKKFLEETCIRPAVEMIAAVEEQSPPTKWSMSVGEEQWRMALEQCPKWGQSEEQLIKEN